MPANQDGTGIWGSADLDAAGVGGDRDAGLAPSMGAVGSAYGNAMVESFWGRMQVELFNRKRWKARIEIATAMHDYIELFRNTRRRHSALGMLTPTEYVDQRLCGIGAGNSRRPYARPVRYQEVEDAHIVPAGYLRGFANGRMTVRHDVTSNRERERSVRSVGTRKRAYSRHRPDGSRIDDVEDSISKLENRVEVVRNAHEHLPFSEEDRSVIAQFAAAQHVRSPKWAEQYKQRVEGLKSEIETHGLPRLGPVASEVVKPALRREAEKHESDTARLVAMQRWLYGFSALFFAMRWTVIRFPRPILITSDHPVVMWREADRALAPSDNAGIGVESLLEVRYPLNSQVCLLMTWLEGVDDLEILRGSRAQAKNINSFTREAAELEWFYLPGTTPPFSDGRSRLVPLSAEIFGEYSEQRISKRRAFGIQLAMKTKNQPLQNQMSFQAFYPGTLKKTVLRDSD